MSRAGLSIERAIGAVTVLRTKGSRIEFAVEPAGDTLLIAFVEHGVLHVDHGSVDPAHAGAIAVVPSWSSMRPAFVGEGTAVALRVERGAIESLVPTLPDRPSVFPRRTTLDRAAVGFAREIVRVEPAVSAVERYATEQLLIELAGSMLLDRFGGGWSNGSPTAVLRDRAIAVIAQSRADPGLNAEAVAREVQSSLRRVQAAFAEVGTSISVEIRRQRAKLARTLLTDPRYDVLAIDEVAEQSGFGTSTSLRRALADVYGVGPSEMRAKRGEAPNGQIAHEPSERRQTAHG